MTMRDLNEAADGRNRQVLAEHADAIRALGKRMVADVIEIGGRLSECKLICGHGNWLAWLEREFGWSADTAERFIRVSTLSNQIPQLAEFDLPLSGLYLLAASSTPEEARNEIIKRAEASEPVAVSDIKETVEKAKRRRHKRHHQRKRGRKPSIATTAELGVGAPQTIKTQGAGDRVLQALALVEEMGPAERRRFLELFKQRYGFSATDVEEVSPNDREWAAQSVEQKAEHIEPADDLDIPDFLRRAS